MLLENFKPEMAPCLKPSCMTSHESIRLIISDYNSEIKKLPMVRIETAPHFVPLKMSQRMFKGKKLDCNFVEHVIVGLIWKFNLIEPLDTIAKHLRRMDVDQKKQVLNGFYHCDSIWEHTGNQRCLFVLAKIREYFEDSEKSYKETMQDVIKLFVEHGMSLMIPDDHQESFMSYESFGKIVFNVDHMIGFKADMINPFQKHPFYSSIIRRIRKNDMIGMICLFVVDWYSRRIL